MYFLVLRIVRWYRRRKRGLLRGFGDEPLAVLSEVGESGPKTISELFGYFNLLQLFAIFAALISASDHYCRRLPQIVRGRHILLPGTSKVIGLTVTLFAALCAVLKLDVSKLVILGLILLLGCLAPLWAPLLAGSTLIFSKFIQLAKILTALGSASYLLAFDDEYLSVVVSPATYRRLGRSTYRRAMFYYLPYFLILAPVVLLAPIKLLPKMQSGA